MLTTLSIVSLDQGKIARRYDVEPASQSDQAEAAAGATEGVNWRVGRAALTIIKAVKARLVDRFGGAPSGQLRQRLG